MNSIGGNITAQIQVKTETGRDRLGSPIFDWVTMYEPKGFLDLSSGDSRYTTYNAKIQESTHIFICDWFPMDVNIQESRMIINNQVYDVKLIDNPMGMKQHYEIFLQFVG